MGLQSKKSHLNVSAFNTKHQLDNTGVREKFCGGLVSHRYWRWLWRWGNNRDCRCCCIWGLQGKCFGWRLHRSAAIVFYVSINKFRKHIQLDIDMRFTLQIQALGWLAAVLGVSNTILEVIVHYSYMLIHPIASVSPFSIEFLLWVCDISFNLHKYCRWLAGTWRHLVR